MDQGMPLAGKTGPDSLRKFLAVHAAFVALHDGVHDLSHFLGRRGAGLGNGLFDDAGELLVSERLGEIGFKDDEFGVFLVR